jgi:membrane-bound metal-dependent hydrolase YbcI (DUF457 family)
MSAYGLRLFGAKLRKRPLAAVFGLLSDYLTYVGMVAFWAFLRVSNRPLSWLERRTGRPVRANVIAWVARRARG